MKKSSKIIAGIMALCLIGGTGIIPASIAPTVSITASAESSAVYEVSKDGVLTVNDMTKFKGENTPSDTEIKEITKIVIADGNETIRDNAFKGYSAVKYVNIPESVTTIGASAFENCEALEYVEISENVTEIGGSCFSGCTSLEEVEIYAHLTVIPAKAFYQCSSLASFNIPDTVEAIDTSAFESSGLKAIVIPDSVKTMAAAFKSCDSLASVEIGSGLASIAKNTFWNCRSLSRATISRNIKEIGDQAFWSAPLANVIFKGTESEWNKIKYDSSALNKATKTYLVKAGDANEDGKATIADAVLIMQSLSNPDEFSISEQGQLNGDVLDAGGGITTQDALAIQMVDIQILTIEELPITSEELAEKLSQNEE